MDSNYIFPPLLDTIWPWNITFILNFFRKSNFPENQIKVNFKSLLNALFT